MDQNKSESPRQFSAQPVARGSFTPTARSFSAAPRPVAQAPLAVQPAPEPQQVTFAPQQFSAPVTAPVVPAPLSFAPPVDKAPAKPRFISTTKIKAIAAGMTVLLVLAGGIQHHLVNSHKQVLGTKTHGRKIPVSDATLGGSNLETSCYTVDIPNSYQVTHTAGCSSVMSAAKAADAAISLFSTPSSSTFTMKDAPIQIREQLKLLGSVTEFKTAPTEVNGIKALKVLYQLGQGNEQALVFVPNLPAKYVTNNDAAGAFMIRGTYGTPSQQSSFDSLVQSLKWIR